MNFIEKILDGFNKVLAFLGGVFSGLFQLIADGFNKLLHFIQKPLTYLYYFLEGIFYFFIKLFDVVVLVVKIFVALFQFIFALGAGILRTITKWLTVDLSPNTKFVSSTYSGFQTVMDLLQPTGLLTVVPLVALAFLWFFFVIKMIGLFGGSIMISPGGRPKDGGDHL